MNIKAINIIKSKIRDRIRNIAKENSNAIYQKLGTLQETIALIQNDIAFQNNYIEDLVLQIGGISNSLLIPEKNKNRPLFLIGSGPSIKEFDLSILKNCYTMSFNRSYIAFKDWGFEPTYFGGLDHVVNKDNKIKFKELIKNSTIKKFFFPKDNIADEYFHSNKTYIISVKEGEPSNPSFGFNKILRVANSGLFGLQVALGLLGFKEVYLLGIDANYTDDVKGVEIVNGEYISREDTDINHFREDYYGKGTTYNKPGNMKWHYPAWKSFNAKFIKGNSEGFRVYNCSESSTLKFFEYKNFNKITKKITMYEKN